MKILVVVLSAAIALAGCGSSSSSSSGSGAASSAASASSSAARVGLAQCMRSHGIDVPDPGPNGPTRGEMQRLQQQYSTSQLNPALTACRSELVRAFPQIDFSPAGQAQRRQKALQFAQCMRVHGVDIPDPSGSGPGLGLERSLSSVDRNSPTFKSASAACASLRPTAAAARVG